jgi:hypothetical protein
LVQQQALEAAYPQGMSIDQDDGSVKTINRFDAFTPEEKKEFGRRLMKTEEDGPGCLYTDPITTALTFEIMAQAAGVRPATQSLRRGGLPCQPQLLLDMKTLGDLKDGALLHPERLMQRARGFLVHGGQHFTFLGFKENRVRFG